VLAQEMFLVQVLCDGARPRICGDRVERHSRNFFQDDSIVSGVGGVFAPTKRGMPGDEDAGGVQRVALPKATNDGKAGVALVTMANFPGAQRFGDRY